MTPVVARLGDIMMALPSTKRQAWRFRVRCPCVRLALDNGADRDSIILCDCTREAHLALPRVWVLVDGTRHPQPVRDVEALCDDDDAVRWVLRGVLPPEPQDPTADTLASYIDSCGEPTIGLTDPVTATRAGWGDLVDVVVALATDVPL